MTNARLIGVLYLIIIATAMFAEAFVRAGVVDLSDGAATAANILEHESLYRIGGVAMLTAITCDVAVAILFFFLFASVDRTVSLLAAVFRLIQVAILGVNLLNHYVPLFLLQNAAFRSAFTGSQLNAFVLVPLRLYADGFHIAMVFFGFACLLLGHLIYRSSLIPRVIGVLMVVAGLCYVTNSVAVLVAPLFARQLHPWILVPCFIGELTLTLWLLVRGAGAPSAQSVPNTIGGVQWTA